MKKMKAIYIEETRARYHRMRRPFLFRLARGTFFLCVLVLLGWYATQAIR